MVVSETKGCKTVLGKCNKINCTCQCCQVLSGEIFSSLSCDLQDLACEVEYLYICCSSRSLLQEKKSARRLLLTIVLTMSTQNV